MLLEHDVNGVTGHANPGAALGYEICIMLPRMLPKTQSRPQSGGLTKSDNILILFGSPGRIRTSDQPVNSRLLYR